MASDGQSLRVGNWRYAGTDISIDSWKKLESSESDQTIFQVIPPTSTTLVPPSRGMVSYLPPDTSPARIVGVGLIRDVLRVTHPNSIPHHRPAPPRRVTPDFIVLAGTPSLSQRGKPHASSREIIVARLLPAVLVLGLGWSASRVRPRMRRTHPPTPRTEIERRRPDHRPSPRHELRQARRPGQG